MRLSLWLVLGTGVAGSGWTWIRRRDGDLVGNPRNDRWESPIERVEVGSSYLCITLVEPMCEPLTFRPINVLGSISHNSLKSLLRHPIDFPCIPRWLPGSRQYNNGLVVKRENYDLSWFSCSTQKYLSSFSGRTLADIEDESAKQSHAEMYCNEIFEFLNRDWGFSNLIFGRILNTIRLMAGVRPHQHVPTERDLVRDPELRFRGILDLAIKNPQSPNICQYLAGLLVGNSFKIGTMTKDQAWDALGGSEALGLADLSNSEISKCHRGLFARIVFSIVTSIPPDYEGTKFAKSVSVFCTTHKEDIEEMWKLKLYDMRLLRIFSLCPEVIPSDKLSKLVDDSVKRLTRLQTHSARSLEVSRENLFSDSIDFLMSPMLGARDPDPVVFRGENGQDIGGLRRDWFSEMLKNFMDPQSGLLVQRLSLDCREDGAEAGYLVLNPKSEMDERTHEAFGRFLGLSIISGQKLSVDLPTMFFARLLNPVHMNARDLAPEEQARSDSYTKLMEMARHTPEDLDGLELDDLPEMGGASVVFTSQNAQNQLQEIIDAFWPEGPKMAAIRRGFDSVLDLPELRATVTVRLLKELVVGPELLKLDELREKAIITATRVQESVWLFNWLAKGDMTRQRNFMRFVTGSTSLVTRNLRIEENITSSNLPTASTCFFVLFMPRYDTVDQFEALMEEAVVSTEFNYL